MASGNRWLTEAGNEEGARSGIERLSKDGHPFFHGLALADAAIPFRHICRRVPEVAIPAEPGVRLVSRGIESATIRLRVPCQSDSEPSIRDLQSQHLDALFKHNVDGDAGLAQTIEIRLELFADHSVLADE